MKITSMRMVGIRCFEDTGDLECGGRFNILAGENNAGKTTLLSAILALQSSPLDTDDERYGEKNRSFFTVMVSDIGNSSQTQFPVEPVGGQRFTTLFRGACPEAEYGLQYKLDSQTKPFVPARPGHVIIPFSSRRRSPSMSHDVTLKASNAVDGTFASLYSRIDLLNTGGHPRHEMFLAALREVVGINISMRPSHAGKDAGAYLNDNEFIPLERMGDGVTEMLGLIVEMCLERDKVFVLEEPEMHLHPRALRALLMLVRQSAEYNQFFIATHSNVVVRELAGEEDSKVFRVFRDGNQPHSPSLVEEVERSPAAHMQLLRELGYEFADFELHDAWLFLEESSAESVFHQILIPWFVPELRGRLRTYAANGVDDVEPSIISFGRLIVFVHLQPVYEGRLWVRVDGDERGKEVATKIRAAFPDFKDGSINSFEHPQFEFYYPARFKERVEQVLSITDRKLKQSEKKALLQEVLKWSVDNTDSAKAEWQASAAEQIKLLKSISKSITSP
jgi:predicted ATPase